MTSLCRAGSRLVRFAGELLDDRRFMLTIRAAVLVEDFVEPDGRIAEHVRTLPRIPRKIRLRLAGNESPVDGGDTVLLRDRKDGVKGAANRACHVLGADY